MGQLVTLHFGDNVTHEDQAEFCLVYAMCYAAGDVHLAALAAHSPERFRLWEHMQVVAGCIARKPAYAPPRVAPYFGPVVHDVHATKKRKARVLFTAPECTPEVQKIIVDYLETCEWDALDDTDDIYESLFIFPRVHQDGGLRILVNLEKDERWLIFKRLEHNLPDDDKPTQAWMMGYTPPFIKVRVPEEKVENVGGSGNPCTYSFYCFEDNEDKKELNEKLAAARDEKLASLEKEVTVLRQDIERKVEDGANTAKELAAQRAKFSKRMSEHVTEKARLEAKLATLEPREDMLESKLEASGVPFPPAAAF
jgi:hypothetical protein